MTTPHAYRLMPTPPMVGDGEQGREAGEMSRGGERQWSELAKGEVKPAWSEAKSLWTVIRMYLGDSMIDEPGGSAE
eukprot:CAMPEP_0174740950 /NCGR_PEP_ID=MMETSP1094-20130205/74936_1 /TAXON_ID=156173 /ORGANISM="Chrysochromulina brevifilum, Strain UTEX LB 985" /LENGTH=75 /DNA_ID=CAMNT_0015944757 /DNA_START=253 /DNA_END=481 /DNA_ORIENTATION=-